MLSSWLCRDDHIGKCFPCNHSVIVLRTSFRALSNARRPGHVVAAESNELLIAQRNSRSEVRLHKHQSAISDRVFRNSAWRNDAVSQAQHRECDSSARPHQWSGPALIRAYTAAGRNRLPDALASAVSPIALPSVRVDGVDVLADTRQLQCAVIARPHERRRRGRHHVEASEVIAHPASGLNAWRRGPCMLLGLDEHERPGLAEHKAVAILVERPRRPLGSSLRSTWPASSRTPRWQRLDGPRHRRTRRPRHP